MPKRKRQERQEKKRARGARYISDVTGPKYQVRKKLRTFNWPLALIILCTTALLFTLQHIWLIFFRTAFWMNFSIAAGAVCLFFALLFNRGLGKNGSSAGKLPADWTQEEKTAYLEKEERMKKLSRFFMALTVPFAFLLCFDLIMIVLGVF